MPTCLSGARITSPAQTSRFWILLRAEFAGGRHERRVKKIEDDMHPGTHLESVDPAVAGGHRQRTSPSQENIERLPPKTCHQPSRHGRGGKRITNKYAEGYRDADGMADVSSLTSSEQLAIDRAKQVFGAEHANVQPHPDWRQHGRTSRPSDPATSC